MLKRSFLTLIILLITTTNGFSDYPIKNITTDWNSKKGLEKLYNSQYKNDFYQMADHFQPQINPLYCAIASSVIILNTIYKDKKIISQKELEIKKPKVFGGDIIPFFSYSQLTFLNKKTDKIKDRKIISLQNITKENENNVKNFDAGLSLQQLSGILKIYKLKTQVHHVQTINKKSVMKFRKLLKKILIEDKKFLLVNFNGKILGLETGGHISPIVAFDNNSDSVLVMDVAGHQNGWFWVSIINLLKAMNTKDGENYRGYMVVYK